MKMLSTPEKLSVKQALSDLSSQEKGLSQKEAAARLEKYGRNELAQKKGKSPIVKFLSQFNDPMIFILLAAAVISILLKEVADSAIILCVVLLNGIVGYVQESRAEKAIDALKKMSTPKAVVKRVGSAEEIDAALLVPGDIVLLEAGRIIPADLRLIESSNLKIEESALTGESVPAEKDCRFVAEGDTAIGDRINMAYMSTPVTYGRGVGIVTATGMDTEIGKIAKILEESDNEMTPLQKRLADLGKLLGIMAVVLCVVLFLLAVVQHRNVFDMLLTAISLAVAAIPEGMPAVVTIVLALGVQRMVKSRTIVRRLPAVETLGAVNVVCSDKTGTLTQNRMTTVKSYFDSEIVVPKELDAQKAAMYLEGFTLCNDASIEDGKYVGDPTETALLDMSALFSMDRPALEQKCPRINEIPFDSDRKLMTTVHNYGDRKLSYTKGALDVILKHTKDIYDGGKIRPITQDDVKNISDAAFSMAKDALRVLALAFRESGGEAVEDGLCFLGLVGMIDPPRPEAKQAVESCRKAGVRTVMITGDHKDTAFAVAREIGIADDASQCISGDELNRMTQEELNEKVSSLRVFARVSPEHKVMIVRALKANGNIVSMTGDGVNDAPSLRAADIGIAMGITGTDVAKGAADMVLTDDNFATIRKAIEEGRNIYNNIKKATIYLLSSNIGEVVTMFIGVAVGWPAPLSAVNILWVNLVTDSLPALALGADTGSPDVMKEKPRAPKESLFSHGGTALLIIYGVLIGLTTLVGFILGCYEAMYGAGHFILSNLAHINFGSKDVLIEGRTFAVTVLAISELFHAVGMRDTKKSIFRMNHLNNKLMWVSVLFGFILQFIIVQTPVSRFFGANPLTLSQWLTVLLLAVMPLVMHEIIVLVQFIKKRAGNKK
jgi:P-type Ca2+ transporter type 2C